MGFDKTLTTYKINKKIKPFTKPALTIKGENRTDKICLGNFM